MFKMSATEGDVLTRREIVQVCYWNVWRFKIPKYYHSCMRFTSTKLSEPLPERSKEFALAAEVIYVHIEHKQLKVLV
jgi:hypothetical protein